MGEHDGGRAYASQKLTYNRNEGSTSHQGGSHRARAPGSAVGERTSVGRNDRDKDMRGIYGQIFIMLDAWGAKGAESS